MKHLRTDELVDLVEGQLTASRARHIEACAECRAQADACRAALAMARQDAVPEPSPLFWEHLSARVSNAIATEPGPAATWRLWLRGGRVQWLAAAAAVVLVAVVSWRTIVDDRAAPSPSADRPMAASAVSDLPMAEPVGEDAWDLIVMATDDLGLEDTEDLGIRVRPGSAERMAEELTAEERVELARLIEDELRRTGA